MRNCCSECCRQQAENLLRLMKITCYKIVLNNFTKLSSRLDELVKLNLKKMKYMVKTNRCKKNNVDNENDIAHGH